MPGSVAGASPARNERPPCAWSGTALSAERRGCYTRRHCTMAGPGRPGSGPGGMPREDTMARPGMRELIGRAMIDKDFLTDLVRDPATVLGGYDLEAEERAAIMQAVARTRKPRRA